MLRHLRLHQQFSVGEIECQERFSFSPYLACADRLCRLLPVRNSFLGDVRSVQVGRSRFSRCYQRLIGYRPTGVFRFAFEGLQHVGEASLMVFIDRAIACNDDHARQARRAKGPEGFAVQIDKG